MLTARALDFPVHPLGLARALTAKGHLRVALLHAGEAGPALLGAGRFSFVGSDPDRASDHVDPTADDDAPPCTDGGELCRLPRWIGVLPYEAHRAAHERPGWAPHDARPPALLDRPSWLRYPAVVAIDHESGRALVAGFDRRAVDALASAVLEARGLAAAEPVTDLEVGEPEPVARHAERVAAARELIAAGDLYQVNLARRLGLTLRSGDALSLYRALSRRAPTPFGACLDLGDLHVACTSPELLLRASTRPGGDFHRLVTAPIKGTRPRGPDALSDAALARELDQDPKERAELAMIIDVERNDLGKVAVPGSVRLVEGPIVSSHRTVHHRSALLTARARADATRADVLAAMLPSGSVTGAPKVRAMEVIASLEASRRGLYTGGLGFVSHDGAVSLAMAIRTAVLRGREGEYFTGGGVVADSDPAREVEETRWKAAQLGRR